MRFPILLMYWIVAVLSDMILICLWLFFTNDFKAVENAFSPRILICINFSCGSYAQRVDTLPMHGGTLTFEWSICANCDANCDANFRILYRFKQFKYILFPQWYFMQSIFRSIKSIIVLKLPLLYLRDLSWHF